MRGSRGWGSKLDSGRSIGVVVMGECGGDDERDDEGEGDGDVVGSAFGRGGGWARR